MVGYADETLPLVGADILISVSDLLGDFVLLYRCWIIWGKNYWVILVPLLTAVAGFCGSTYPPFNASLLISLAPPQLA